MSFSIKLVKIEFIIEACSCLSTMLALIETNRGLSMRIADVRVLME